MDENSEINFDDVSRKLGRSPNAVFHRLRRLMGRNNANAEVGE